MKPTPVVVALEAIEAECLGKPISDRVLIDAMLVGQLAVARLFGVKPENVRIVGLRAEECALVFDAVMITWVPFPG